MRDVAYYGLCAVLGFVNLCFVLLGAMVLFTRSDLSTRTMNTEYAFGALLTTCGSFFLYTLIRDYRNGQREREERVTERADW